MPTESVEAASNRRSSSGCSPANAPNPTAPVDSTAARSRSTTASALSMETPAAAYVCFPRAHAPSLRRTRGPSDRWSTLGGTYRGSQGAQSGH